jgi:hypothetical protein
MDLNEYSSSMDLWSMTLGIVFFLFVWRIASPPRNAILPQQFKIGFVTCSLGSFLLFIWNSPEIWWECWSAFMKVAVGTMRLRSVSRFYECQAAALDSEFLQFVGAVGFMSLLLGVSGLLYSGSVWLWRRRYAPTKRC